jgi:superfamily I DNA and RNA helicase
VTISTIFRAKGNEAWKVYACRFDYATKPLSWKQDETEIHKRNEAFVALTRARVWCVVTGLESPIFDELRSCLEQYPNFSFLAFNKRTIKRNNDESEDRE